MVASMTHPHDPYVIPQRYWDRYADVDIDMPRVRDGRGSTRTRIRGACATSSASTCSPSTRRRCAPRAAPTTARSPTSTIRSARCSRRSRMRGFADDTVVLLLADHGDMLGERGLWYKMNFFEPACRIPLIVHAPRRFAARRVRESASLVDILPTLCELAGGALGRLRDAAGRPQPGAAARRARRARTR